MTCIEMYKHFTVLHHIPSTACIEEEVLNAGQRVYVGLRSAAQISFWHLAQKKILRCMFKWRKNINSKNWEPAKIQDRYLLPSEFLCSLKWRSYC